MRKTDKRNNLFELYYFACKLFRYLGSPLISPIIACFVSLILLHMLSIKFIENSSKRFLRHEKDLRGYLSSQLTAQRTDQPAVYNIGGSSFLRAIQEDFDLEKVFYDRYQFFNLASPSQTMAESYGILKKLSLRPNDLIVLHINISRLNTLHPLDHWMCGPYFYTIRTSDLVSILTQHGVTPTYSKLCQFSFLSRRKLIYRLFSEYTKNSVPVDYKGIYPMDIDIDPSALKIFQDHRRSVLNPEVFKESWLKININNTHKNIEIIKSFFEFTRKHGVKLVVVDLPTNFDWLKRHHDYSVQTENQYLLAIESIKQIGIEYVSFRSIPEIKDNHFYDHTHLLQSGRKLFERHYVSLVENHI